MKTSLQRPVCTVASFLISSGCSILVAKGAEAKRGKIANLAMNVFPHIFSVGAAWIAANCGPLPENHSRSTFITHTAALICGIVATAYGTPKLASRLFHMKIPPSIAFRFAAISTLFLSIPKPNPNGNESQQDLTFDQSNVTTPNISPERKKPFPRFQGIPQIDSDNEMSPSNSPRLNPNSPYSSPSKQRNDLHSSSLAGSVMEESIDSTFFDPPKSKGEKKLSYEKIRWLCIGAGCLSTLLSAMGALSTRYIDFLPTQRIGVAAFSGFFGGWVLTARGFDFKFLNQGIKPELIHGIVNVVSTSLLTAHFTSKIGPVRFFFKKPVTEINQVIFLNGIVLTSGFALFKFLDQERSLKELGSIFISNTKNFFRRLSPRISSDNSNRLG